jgi:hypothetical protein
MQQIEIYLQKFKDFGLKEKILKEKVCKIIKEETKVFIKEEDIDLKNGVLRINISGAGKSEIFIKRNKIKERLESNLDIL